MLWRDAADVVQLLRLTGARVNEGLHLTLSQFNWSKGTVRLYATKTETDREVPLSSPLRCVIRGRIKDGLTADDYLFPKTFKIKTYDHDIQRACREAAKQAKLAYGQKNGFTLHSLRHTFITDLMEKTGNDAGTVMKYSGHKTLQSFSNYLHPTDQGRILAIQALESVGGLLAGFEGEGSQRGQEGQAVTIAKAL